VNKVITSARGHRLGAAVVAAVLFGLAGAAAAQEKAPPPDVAAQANNPLANFTAFNVHNYYIGELTDLDENGNAFWMRFAKPFRLGKTSWLMRASLPVNTLPVGETLAHETGLGDLNVFAAYLIPMGGRKLSVGIGPQITAPTASKDGLGSDKWSVGLVHTLFNFGSKKFQYGYLLSWQASVAGREEAADVNLGSFQPFLFYQLGRGTYLRSSAVSMSNFENSTYTVPIGFGIGQVIPRAKVVFNAFVELQYSVADKGAGYAKWQIFFALNTQFK
jgi:hypothetical protein